jgi:hypothetical protein
VVITKQAITNERLKITKKKKKEKTNYSSCVVQSVRTSAV